MKKIVSLKLKSKKKGIYLLNNNLPVASPKLGKEHNLASRYSENPAWITKKKKLKVLATDEHLLIFLQSQ